MSYIEESLSAGEKIEGVFLFPWFAWVPSAIWFLLGPLTFGVTWIVAIYGILQLRFTDQGVTNKRVIMKTGIISRSTQEMKISSIETVEIRQSILGRIFGYGTVKVTGRGLSDVTFRFVDDPMSVKRQIESVGSNAA